MCINKKNVVKTVIWCTDKIQLCNHLNFLAVLGKVLERNLELEDLTRYLKVQCGRKRFGSVVYTFYRNYLCLCFYFPEQICVTNTDCV